MVVWNHVKLGDVWRGLFIGLPPGLSEVSPPQDFLHRSLDQIMGEVAEPTPVLPILTAFSRHETALAWAQARAAEAWGPIALASEPFAFAETTYYEPTMGASLRKPFFAFSQLADPADLVERKLQTNRWEEQYALQSDHTESRPLNLDPGYITLGKLVLASTKDFAHRIYLAQGIYAEVTLQYKHGDWRSHEWTFADYRRADYQQFFDQCRDYLRGRLRGR